jgi:hypothetical protein
MLDVWIDVKVMLDFAKLETLAMDCREESVWYIRAQGS